MNPILTQLKLSILFIVLFSATTLFSQVKKENKLLIGRLELSEKQYKSAIEKFNYIIINEPPNYEPYYFRGIAKLELGDIVGAENDFTEAIKLRPFFIDNYIIRASTRERLVNYNGAFADFDAAISIDSSNSDIYLNRAITHNSLHNYEQAIDDCNKEKHNCETLWIQRYPMCSK